jgi:hypothetical protein
MVVFGGKGSGLLGPRTIHVEGSMKYKRGLAVVRVETTTLYNFLNK